MQDPTRIPVIVGVGEIRDRPEHVREALEPLDLMERALIAADSDAGGGLLQRAESLDLVGLISWRYENPAAQLCQQLKIEPSEARNASMGGETPVRLVHDAAIRIATGKQSVALIVGGEALHARNRAKKEGVELPWTPAASRDKAIVFPSSTFKMSPIAKMLGVRDPAQIYPLYEMAAQASWGQTPREGNGESARLWARYAKVAACNANAWITSGVEADEIATPGPANRLINWPYPKLMVANPNVNQAAAIIVTSRAAAREAGVPEEKIVHIWGGAAAVEPEDFLRRDTYHESSAQYAALEEAVRVAGGEATRFDHIELYSCFPVVPKMALRAMGLEGSSISPTVSGGLTFFGGPLNNYMAHAMAEMVRKLRAAPQSLGLLYGQGGFVNKHHTLVLGAAEPAAALAHEYSVQDRADALRGEIPDLDENYRGPATIETYTAEYGRDGRPTQGIVIARTPDGARTMARIRPENEAALAPLLSQDGNAIGVSGCIRTDSFGKPSWEVEGASARERAARRRHCLVQREGHLTIVMINRPDAMNALHPACNAELAEVFDEFAADPEQWVAIITGSGDRAFSAGNDLKYFSAALARGERIETPTTGFGGLTSRIELNKPVIAAVNGTAMGGGFEIALACDLIIASRSASFALPEPKVGLAALAGGLLRLPRQIGLKRAMGMILTGRRVSAQEGYELGFVNEVTEPKELLIVARRWASEIISNSPMSVRASKEIVRRSLETSIAEADREQHSYPATRALFRSPDPREGSLAFSQKRPPRWESS